PLAHDDVLDRDVALKVMSGRYAGDDEFVERFRREAQSAAALSHPNIVSIFDRGEADDGTYYIAMEYLPGGTLKDRILKRGALPPRTAAAVACQIAEALRAAHERDVIHRDIKPHNILITGSGDVKVTDFGIARAASSSTMTRTGHILGTAHYISPEQAMGEPVGPASDLYSLGVVLYEMLTGEMPFDADTPLGIAMKHVNGHLVPPQVLNPEVPDGINAITMRLLQKDPAARYATDDELIDDLERVLSGLDPSGATTEMATSVLPAATTRLAPAPPPPPQGVRPAKRKRRAAPVFLALLVLALLGLLAWAGYALFGNQQQQEPEAAMISVPSLVNMDVDAAEDEFGDDFKIETTAEVEGERPEGTIVTQNPEDGEAREGSTISVRVVGTQVADVPDVLGENRNAAENVLRDAGFDVSVDEQESSFENEGRVIAQDPDGGGSVERGSEVSMVVGTGPDTVRVPNVTGVTVEQAGEILEENGLVLGEQVDDYSETVPEDSVISQDPGENESVEPGEAVDVTVSLGVEQVEVPEVYGVSVETAQARLSSVGINSEPIEVAGDEPAGTALSTEPGVGALVEPGSTLPLYFSAGPPEPTVASPEPTTEPEASAPAEEPESESNAPQNVPPNVQPNAQPNVQPNVQENARENENAPNNSGRGNGSGQGNRDSGGGGDDNGGGGGND
ncbi:MAG: Serine/threonine protein kinase PrkC, regulator of stationary phase, partial [uncultured Rubrobacteraceae bacterium]